MTEKSTANTPPHNAILPAEPEQQCRTQAVTVVGKYTIESGVPMPPKSRGRKTGFTAALRTMAVGDSMTIPVEQRRCIAGTARHVPGAKFTSRKIDAETVRIWRFE